MSHNNLWDIPVLHILAKKWFSSTEQEKYQEHVKVATDDIEVEAILPETDPNYSKVQVEKRAIL